MSEAPYQIAIVTFEDGRRVRGERVSIGDRVEWTGDEDGVPQFEKA